MMYVRCPECEVSIEWGATSTDAEVKCEDCGHSFEPHSILLDSEDGADVTAVRQVDSTLPRFSAGDRISKYSVLKLVGRGGFGTVYHAFDTQLERDVAIKLPRHGALDSQQVELFVREARLAAQVTNPNIVRVYEIGTYDDVAYIVTDFIDGKSLAAWRHEMQPDMPTSIRLCITIARALHDAHEKGIVHRDLKPGNVLIDQNGEPHVTDFGLAKREIAEDETIAGRGDILGTPAYMSPEQARGRSHLTDRRSDLYSLAVMLYELLACRSPYQSSGSDLLQYVRDAQIAPLREVAATIPHTICQLCEEALQLDPDDRPKSAKVFADRLEESLGEIEKSSARIGGVSLSRRSLLGIGAGASILLASGIAGGLWINRDNDSDLPSSDESNGVAHGEAPSSTAVLVNVATSRAGARVALALIDPDTGEPDDATVRILKDSTPAKAWLEPGNYFVEVAHGPDDFQQVVRTVPTDVRATPSRYPHRSWTVATGSRREISWQMITVISPDEGLLPLSNVPGGEFQSGWAGHPMEPTRVTQVADFQMMVHEMSVGLFYSTRGSLPIDWPDGVAQPGLREPVRHVRFDEAIACLESCGLRLPTRSEFDYAFTNGGTTEFPEGSVYQIESAWTIGEIDANELDRTVGDLFSQPIVGLSSNVLEWTSTVPQVHTDDGQVGIPDDVIRVQWQLQRFIRGGPAEALNGPGPMTGGPQELASRAAWVSRTHEVGHSAAGLGFRGVRDTQPRWIKQSDFSGGNS